MIQCVAPDRFVLTELQESKPNGVASPDTASARETATRVCACLLTSTPERSLHEVGAPGASPSDSRHAQAPQARRGQASWQRPPPHPHCGRSTHSLAGRASGHILLAAERRRSSHLYASDAASLPGHTWSDAAERPDKLLSIQELDDRTAAFCT